MRPEPPRAEVSPSPAAVQWVEPRQEPRALPRLSRRVARWSNLVMGGPDAEQGDSQRRPEWREDALAGGPVVRLDGHDDFLRLALPVGGTDQSLLCWTEEGNAFTEQGIFFGVGQHEATFRFGTGDAYPHYKTPFVLEHPNDDRFVFALALLDGQERSLFINGEVPRGRTSYESDELIELHARAEGEAVRAEPVAWIGKGRFEAPTSFWAGELAELFVYDASLDESERQSLEAYVTCRYFPTGY